MRLVAVVSLAHLLALLQCSTSTKGGEGATPPAKAAPPSVTAQLDVVVVRAPEEEPRHATLTCAGGKAARATGFIEDAEAACRAVAERRGYLLEGPSRDRMCTMIYGGPQVARITGVIDGRPVEREVNRSNGCWIADWRALQPLLGPPDA